MESHPLDEKLLLQLQKLRQKYDAMGQDLSSYLDGLLYSNYLTYWDYIHLDTLLSLQNPKTDFSDENIFIMYHQITELYFKLSLQELEQISLMAQNPDAYALEMRMKRLISYFKHLCNSFDIMVFGMEREQFLKFRMSLLPASGFQSGQYRFIEFFSTDMKNLTEKDLRAGLTGQESTEQLYDLLYWKNGATELSTGKKTLTLKQFEEKYRITLIRLGEKNKEVNLWKVFCNLSETEKPLLEPYFKNYDQLVNINWTLSHLKAAAHYLQNDVKVISATGGTNWQQYLPPRFQRVVYFPELWTAQELEEWGRQYVKELFEKPKA